MSKSLLRPYPGQDISGLSPTPSITSPGNSTSDLSFNSDEGGWGLGNGYVSIDALDADIPSGNYSISVGELSDGIALTVPDDAFPHIPAVTGGSWRDDGKLNINARTASTIQFNTFPEYASGGIMQFEIDDVDQSNPLDLHTGSKILHQQNVSFYGAPAQPLHHPGNTLQPGHLYIAEIGFGAFSTVNQTTLPGTAAVVLFQNHTDFFILTLP